MSSLRSCPTYKPTNCPATISRVLAEDTSHLGQTQGSFLLMVQQAAQASWTCRFSSSPKSHKWRGVIQVDAVHTTGFVPPQMTPSLGTPSFYKVLHAHLKSLCSRGRRYLYCAGQENKSKNRNKTLLVAMMGNFSRLFALQTTWKDSLDKGGAHSSMRKLLFLSLLHSNCLPSDPAVSSWWAGASR